VKEGREEKGKDTKENNITNDNRKDKRKREGEGGGREKERDSTEDRLAHRFRTSIDGILIRDPANRAKSMIIQRRFISLSFSSSWRALVCACVREC